MSEEAEKPFDHEAETPEVKEEVRTFTQEELEAQLGARLAREREKFADYEALKEKAAKLDEIEEEQKSELEKLLERAEKAEAERDRLAESTKQQQVRSAIIAEASRQGAIDPEDIVALLSGKDLLGEDGEVAGVDKAVTELLESKPHLAGSKTPAPADQGARATAPTEADPVSELGRQILKSAGR